MTKTQALKLVEITSQRQADNGTVCYSIQSLNVLT